MTTIRSPICSILAHVDHGKTSLLDKIRGSAIAAGEAGGITQAIGVSIVPLTTIQKVCGPLLHTMKIKFTIPGLLFIDTPGHAAFTTLRKRGGNLADIAVLVIDINEGFKPQTFEALDILRSYKTPFIIVANKIDLIRGWQQKEQGLIKNILAQQQNTLNDFETKIYQIVSKLYENSSMNAERFDRVEDYTKQIAIVPVSAKTGEGIPEMLMVILGLAQKFLEQCLECSADKDAKGTILEVKEEKGMGVCLDVILYDGMLKVNDTIVIGTLGEPLVTKVRSLFEPMPLAEMRDKKSKFKPVKMAVAATGVKISAPEIEEAVAGMPLRSCSKDQVEKIKSEIKKEVEEVVLHTDQKGIVVKADTLGSLEAMSFIMKQQNIPVKKAAIGNVNKKDLADAEANYIEDPLMSVVLGFNVEDASGVCVDKVKVITNQIIYKLVDDFKEWQDNKKREMQSNILGLLNKPCKLEFLKGYIFRQNNPAVVGIEVLAGKLKSGMPLMNKKGEIITEAKSIQLEKESVTEAEKGKQVAVSMPKVTVGRQIHESDIFYSALTEEEFRRLKDLKEELSGDEIGVMKEIAAIKRKENPMWGI